MLSRIIKTITISICLAALMSMPLLASAADYGKAVISIDNVSGPYLELYSDESYANDKIIGKYPSGVEVTLLSDPAHKLAMVRIGDTVGYMNSAYLVDDARKIALLPEQQLPVMAITLKNPKSSLRLRSIASTKGKSLGSYKHGQEVVVLGIAGDWSHVQIGDKIGYMLTSYLREAGSVKAESSVTMPGQNAKPLIGEGRAYYASKTHDIVGYTVIATMKETAQGVFSIEIDIQYPEQWSVNDDINSFALYVNGKKMANVPYISYGTNPSQFATTVEVSGEIQSIRILPNWFHLPEYEPEAVDFTI